MQPKDRRVDANLAGGGNIVLLVVQEQQSGRQVCRLVCFAFFTFLVAIIGALIVAGRLFGLSKAPQSPSCHICIHFSALLLRMTYRTCFHRND